MGWTAHERIDGIDVGYTDALWIFPYRGDSDLRKAWNRPQIALTRKSIRDLAALNMSAKDLIQFLFDRIKTAEQIVSEDRQKPDSRFVPMYRMKKGFVYFMYCAEKELMKIGCSQDPNKRKTVNSKAIGATVEILKTYATDGMFELENEFHELFSPRRFEGEWFRIAPKHLKIADRYLARKQRTAV